jgi:hypothetical protein
MKKIFFTVVVAISGLVYFGCKDDEDEKCTEAPVASSYEALYIEDGSRKYMIKSSTIDTSKNPFGVTITDETSYKKYITGTLKNYTGKSDSLPVIDFTKKSLLAGCYISKFSDKVQAQTIEKACNTYTLTTTIGGGARPASTYVYYFAVVEKTDQAAEFKVVSKH